MAKKSQSTQTEQGEPDFEKIAREDPDRLARYLHGIDVKVTLRFTPLTNKHLQAIGEVSAAWTLLEGKIELGIWGFSGLPMRTARIFTADMRIRQRLQTLGVLGHQKLENDVSAKAELDEIINNIKLRENDRNKIIHAEWQFSDIPGSAAAVRIKLKNNKRRGRHVEITAEDKTPDQISDVALELNKASVHLERFLLSHNAYGPP